MYNTMKSIIFERAEFLQSGCQNSALEILLQKNDRTMKNKNLAPPELLQSGIQHRALEIIIQKNPENTVES